MMKTLRDLITKGMIYRVKGRYNEAHSFALTCRGAKGLGFNLPLSRVYWQTRYHDLAVNRVRFIFEDLGLGEKFISMRDLRLKKNDSILEALGNVRGSDGVFFIPSEGGNEVVVMEVEVAQKKPFEHRRILSKFKDNSQVGIVLCFLASPAEYLTALTEWRNFEKSRSTKLYVVHLGEFLKFSGDARVRTLRGILPFHKAFNLRNWVSKVKENEIDQKLLWSPSF